MSDEKIIEAAYEKIAAAAPPPERVRARILARSQAHRQRRAVLVGAGSLGAVAAVTAVGVPLARRSTPSATAPSASAAASPSAPAGPLSLVPLRLTVGWLPTGVGEQYRTATLRGATVAGSTRSWTLNGVPYPTDGSVAKGVTLSIGERIDDNSGTPVTIGDVTGKLRVTDSSFVEWTPPGGPSLIVSVYGLPDSTAVALRMARSVIPTRATMPVWAQAAWIPARFRGTVTAALLPGVDGGWRQDMTFSSPNHAQTLRITARTTEPTEPTLHKVHRSDGVWLSIPEDTPGVLGPEPAQPPTRHEAERLLTEFVYHAPDLDWVGSHTTG
ncbi:hypothetical protein JIG36_38470 [Actinoplanes sp. LDG1-06]|uniref:Uncharacterized protein n=1 Tax=Paractinoplanes ovalisporus TaxID=2810368 RepID=A0ABS2ANJ6_9ACTN|nr:hypothetical protein [Actinoplanes ovalisporus]MBM2621405.1 hypothetical protein [Actinoplanes ovalisporus]